MPWEQIFFFIMAIITVAWAILIFAPRREVVIPLLREVVVFGICLFYFVPIVSTLFIIPDTVPIPNFFDLDTIYEIFNNNAGTTTVWQHMAVLDLFVGLWIASDADSRGIGRVAQVPFLLLTFMFCPIGIVVWFIARRFLPEPINPSRAI